MLVMVVQQFADGLPLDKYETKNHGWESVEQWRKVVRTRSWHDRFDDQGNSVGTRTIDGVEVETRCRLESR